MLQIYPLGDMKEAIELLERPMELPQGGVCNMRHEKINRDIPAEVARVSRLSLKTLSLYPECKLEDKLGGCPHLLERLVVLLETIRKAFPFNVALGEVSDRMNQRMIQCVTLDARVRIARTGMEAGAVLEKYAPTVEVAEHDSAPILAEYYAIIENPAYLADRAEAARILKELLI